jgi:LPXTG-motif cell wall-anchored protein
VAAQPAGTAPSTLAFTGADPLLLIVLGLGLAGGTAALLMRDRRRSAEDR